MLTVSTDQRVEAIEYVSPRSGSRPFAEASLQTIAETIPVIYMSRQWASSSLPSI